MVDWPDVIRAIFTEETAFTVSVAILFIGIILSYLVWRWVLHLLQHAGIDEAVEGTPFERTAQGFGTSTIGMLALISGVAVYIGTIVVALNVAQLLNPNTFWSNFTGYLPRIFIAAVAIIVGMIAGDKGRLAVHERLRSIKLPEAGLIPELVRYSIFFVAALIALAQLGVATTALVVLLAAYVFGLVFLGGLAFKDLLSASAAGVYLLLTEPSTIGDEIQVDDKRGIVQEIDVFVTRIESDGEEYIVPNQIVLRAGVVRIRD
jgi:small-conductance mechanosensitive channel